MPTNSSETENREGRPAPPNLPNYLPWAIASMIFCCLPLGIVATIYAFRVNVLKRQQNNEEAGAFATRARLWLAWTAITGGAIILTFLVLYALALYAAGYRP